MLGQQPVLYIRSTADSDFNSGVAQNALHAIQNLSFPNELKSNEFEIISITIQSDENLEWDVYLFRKDTGSDTNLNVDTFVEYVNFPATVGKQIGGSGQYYYAMTGLNIFYRDDDESNEIHVGLVNRSTAAKASGASGSFVIEFTVTST